MTDTEALITSYTPEMVVVCGRIVVVCSWIVVVCSRIVVGCMGGWGGWGGWAREHGRNMKGTALARRRPPVFSCSASF